TFNNTTTNQQKLHLICYYTKSDVINDKLQIPSQDEKVKTIGIPKGMYPETQNVEGVVSHHYSPPNHHHHHHHHHHHNSHPNFNSNDGRIERSQSPSP